MFQHCVLSVMVIVAAVLAAGRVSRGDESPAPRLDGESIQLPSGAGFKIASFEAHPRWTQCFPPDRPFYAEQYTEGQLKGMHSRYVARLNGPSAMLYENGNVKALSYYPDGHRQGPCRVWDEEKRMLLYAQYKDDKKHGVTCLFKDGVPWLLQQWNMGILESETIVVRKGDGYVSAEGSEQLAQAQKKLSAVEEERTADEGELNSNMRRWFSESRKQAEEEKDKALYKAIHARGEAERQRIRQEADARVAAAHTHEYGRDRAGRVAATDGAFAARDLKGAKQNLSAAKNQLNEKLREMGAAAKRDSKKLYEFAMASLEGAIPSDPSDSRPNLSSKQPDPQDGDQPSHKKGKKRKKQ
ncbi:MAG: hypothetical protein ABSF26_02485 [Thermoguttaceae bacterium]